MGSQECAPNIDGHSVNVLPPGNRAAGTSSGRPVRTSMRFAQVTFANGTAEISLPFVRSMT